jgi:hypothetical protein
MMMAVQARVTAGAPLKLQRRALSLGLLTSLGFLATASTSRAGAVDPVDQDDEEVCLPTLSSHSCVWPPWVEVASPVV